MNCIITSCNKKSIFGDHFTDCDKISRWKRFLLELSEFFSEPLVSTNTSFVIEKKRGVLNVIFKYIINVVYIQV